MDRRKLDSIGEGWVGLEKVGKKRRRLGWIGEGKVR